MAKLEFGESQAELGVEVPPTSLNDSSIKEKSGTDVETSTTNGLSSEEFNDPNNIEVTVADKIAPLVILFGPPACGKTMTLIRLTRYLHSIGYKVSPKRDFRPANDTNYHSICDGFDTMINQNDAASSTSNISFMLVDVIKDGKRLCQILEAPGEYYFNPRSPQAPFPSYVNTIINSNNRKIWILMVEPRYLNASDRNNYVTKISSLKRNLHQRDKAVFLFNKIDETNFIQNKANIHIGSAKKEVENLYPNIFVPFKNQNPITRFWNDYLFDFVPFQTGNFTVTNGGSLKYQEGPDEYPSRLWKIILKRIRG